MTCNEVQRLITPFINDELENEKLEEFIHHLKICEDCRDELEVYYTLFTGMRQLDDDKNLSGNYHLELENKIKKIEERLKHRKYYIIRKRIVLFAIILFVALFSSIGVEEYVKKTTESKERLIPMHYYYYHRTDAMDNFLKEYYNQLHGKDNGKDQGVDNE